MRLDAPSLIRPGLGWRAQVASHLAPVGAGLLAGAALVACLGESPLEIYRLLLWGAGGTRSHLVSTLRWATPLILSGLAVSWAYRAGLFNMGGEGQIFVGAFAGALAGIYLTPLGVWQMPAGLAAAALGGGLFALVPALLRVYEGVNEIVSTLMLNYVAVLLTDYLVVSRFLPGGQALRALEVATPRVAPLARIPLLAPPHPLNAGLFVAIGAALLAYLAFRRTVPGYRMEAVGSSRAFARYGGISPERVGLGAFVLSGMIAGLAGGIEVLGSSHRFVSGFAAGLGFDGILVALLGRAHPLGVVLAGLFYAVLKNGGFVLERMTDLDRNVAVVLQATILLFTSVRVLSEPWAARRPARAQRGGEAAARDG